MSSKNLTKAEEKEFDRLIKKLGWTPIRRFWFGGDTYMTGPLYSEACYGMPDELRDFADEVDFLVVGYHADDDIWERIAELEAEAEEEDEEEDDENDFADASFPAWDVVTGESFMISVEYLTTHAYSYFGEVGVDYDYEKVHPTAQGYCDLWKIEGFRNPLAMMSIDIHDFEEWQEKEKGDE